MKILGIHTKYFNFHSREKAMEQAEVISQENHNKNINRECLVIFISVEKEDEKSPSSVSEQLVSDIIKKSEVLGVNLIIIYPYVHLTENPSSPAVAMKVLDEIEKKLPITLEIFRAPFGWYKSFEISCLGHPLSEWSGRYFPDRELKKSERKGSEFIRYVIVDLKGNTYEISPEDFGDCPVFSEKEKIYSLLKQFVSNELSSKSQSESIPKHIGYMQKHELVDYCEASEKGHYKWYPKGLLIQKLILDYANNLAREWGAFEMKNPIIIRGDHNVVGELMGEFHERDYRVDGGRGISYMRYASDPLAFPFMQKVRFTFKQTPLKVYEEATCFRNEQDGEVSGLKRVRNFMMTDMHAACATVEQAGKEFELLCLKFASLMNDIIAPGRWVLGWEGTEEFFEENKERLINTGKKMKVPAFFKLMKHMSHYYAMKNEYQTITEDGSNVQVSTVQWDVKDGERFNIGYINEEGKKVPCPVIIHASSFGSIERTLCSILENIAIDEKAGIPPMFPLWLSPTQVRIIPVSEEYLPFASELGSKIRSHNIRVDIDDRGETVGKSIRNGEKEWIPYLLVAGEKEISSGLITVRQREDRSQKIMSLEDFIEMVKKKTENMPFRPLPLPVLLSRRPLFHG
jgi:threonyl-tRNA synthetase